MYYNTANTNGFSAPGMPTMGRRNQRTTPAQPAQPANTMLPAAVTQSAQPATPQNTMLPGVRVTPGLRQNIVNRATATARGNALQTAQGTSDYKTGAGALDALRAEFGVNDKGISPEEANARRQKMFADARYKNASSMTGDALKPITMAGHNAGGQMKEALAGVSHLTPGFFEQRQAGLDANARANEMNTANVGVQNANAGLTDMQRSWMQTMLPESVKAAGLQNESAALQNNAYPGWVATEQKQMEAQIGKIGADTGMVQAQTGRIQNQTDAPTLTAQANAQGNSANEARVRSLEATITRLQTELAKYGKPPEAKGADKEAKFNNAMGGGTGTTAAAAPPASGNDNGMPKTQADGSPLVVGQRMVQKSTGKNFAWNGSEWVAQ